MLGAWVRLAGASPSGGGGGGWGGGMEGSLLVGGEWGGIRFLAVGVKERFSSGIDALVLWFWVF